MKRERFLRTWRAPARPSSDFVPIRRVQIKVSAGVTGYYVEPLQGDGPPIFFRADWIASKRYSKKS